MTARFGAALLVVALVAGFLISTLLYPPATVGAAVAAVALVMCLGRVASISNDP
jgi:hypothetical protein